MTAQMFPLTECRKVVQAGGSMKIVDVRTPGEYARVHAQGAKLMPLSDLTSTAIAAEFGKVHEPIYLICHKGQRAREAFGKFLEAGITNVCCIEGGTEGWESFGLPVERSTSGGVISLERQVRIAAGLIILLGVALTVTVNFACIAIPALIGAGLVFAGISDWCGMALILGRMPWNRRLPAKC